MLNAVEHSQVVVVHVLALDQTAKKCETKTKWEFVDKNFNQENVWITKIALAGFTSFPNRENVKNDVFYGRS